MMIFFIPDFFITYQKNPGFLLETSSHEYYTIINSSNIIDPR